MGIANINLRLQNGCRPAPRLAIARRGPALIWKRHKSDTRLLNAVTIGGAKSADTICNNPTGEFDVSGY
jgi:hypothetical protein